MNRVLTLFIQKSGRKDDKIDVHVSNVPGMYRIVFSPNDSSSKYTFFMNRERALDYISNMLRTLADDVEPFDYIQVATHIAPSILYNVADLEDREIRVGIMDSILYALEAQPKKNETA